MISERRRPAATLKERLAEYSRSLGPGLVSGASDTDPTTVGTMAVVGASSGYTLSWLTLLTYPMLAAIQMISAQVGVVTRRGLQETVKTAYGRRWGLLLLLSVVAVNLVTLGADLEAGAAALGLLLHIDYRWIVLPFAAVLLALLLAGSYQQVERVLKYALLIMLAYVVSAFLAHPNWPAVLTATVLPQLTFDGDHVQGALAILGTTLTSYAYVWEVVELSERRLPIDRLGLARADAGLGMVVAVATFWFILIATGATLGTHHKHVETAQQAAEALRPVAGPAASYLFGIGLLASAFIAVPVLAATTGYLLGAEFDFSFGLSKSFSEATEFYIVVAAALLLAAAISFIGISAIQLLYVASIAGGLGTPISLAFLLVVARDRRVMGARPVGRALVLIGWLTFAVVTLVSALFLVQLLSGHGH